MIIKINKDGNITDKSDFIQGVPERWVGVMDGNMILIVPEENGERTFYSVFAEEEESLSPGELISSYSGVVNSFSPYTAAVDIPNEFLFMTKFLFLNELSVSSQFSEYIVSADELTVSLYKVIPDYSTN